jgi:hypothetical protein
VRLNELLDGYFRDAPQRRPLYESNFSSSLPVIVKKSEWEIDDEGLLRSFKFRDRSSLKDFTLAALDLEDDVLHRVKLTIEGDSVSVFCSSKATPQGRQADEEFMGFLDEVYSQVGEQVTRQFNR